MMVPCFCHLSDFSDLEKAPSKLLYFAVQLKPWKSQGSEEEVARLHVKPLRAAAALTLERPRRAYHRDATFADKDAQELHAMSAAHMELRPFKDGAFSTRRTLLDSVAQAAPDVAPAAIQVSDW